MVKTKRFLVLGLAIMLAFAMLVGVLAPVRTVEADGEPGPVAVNSFISSLTNTPRLIAFINGDNGTSNQEGNPDGNIYNTNGFYITSENSSLNYNSNPQEIMSAVIGGCDLQNITEENRLNLISLLEHMCDASGNHLNYVEIFGSMGQGDNWATYMYHTETSMDNTHNIATYYDSEMDQTLTLFYVNAPSNSGSGSGSGSGASTGVVTNTLVATLSVIVLGAAITLLSVKKRTNK